MKLRTLVVSLGVSTLLHSLPIAPSAHATGAANIDAKCANAAVTALFRHDGATGAYTAQATMKCSVAFRFRIVVKENGSELPGLATTLGPFARNTSHTGSTAAIPVTPGHKYQIVVVVATGGGQSLGYLTSGGPQVLVAATRQNLARYLLKSSKVSTSGRLVTADLQAASNNTVSSAGVKLSTTMLAVLVEVATKHRYTITSLEGGGTGHAAGSYHYSGVAFDLAAIDGGATTGRDAASLAVIRQIKSMLPSGSGIGQSNCGTNPSLPNGVMTFADSCNHLHVQLPRGTA